MRQPIRTCVGCRQRSPADQLVRVARHLSDGTLHIDRSASGRGAWLCRGAVREAPAPSCLELAVRRKAFSRAFRMAVDAAEVAVLRETVEERARIDSGDADSAIRRRRD